MIVRIGKVTGLYPDEGKIQVYYEDTNTTAEKLPLVTFGKEYKMPEMNETVLCLHSDIDGSTGFVLGTFYNADVLPPQNGAKYKKEIVKDKARIEFYDNKLQIYAPEVKIITDHGTTTL